MHMNNQKIDTNKVPGNWIQAKIITKYTLLDYLRSRRFLILLVITISASAVLSAAANIYPEFRASNLDFYTNWWGETASFMVILSAVFFGGDAVAGEFQNKTGYFSLPNPIKRSTIYLGKWLSAFVASSVILAIYAAIAMANGAYYFGSIPTEFLCSLAFSWVYLIAGLGFTFFFSALFKNSSYSILVTAIMFLFIFNIVNVACIQFAQTEPWFMVTYGSEIMGNVLSVPYPDHIVTYSMGDIERISYNATIPEGLAIMTVWFVITTAVGLLLFERKEFN